MASRFHPNFANELLAKSQPAHSLSLRPITKPAGPYYLPTHRLSPGRSRVVFAAVLAAPACSLLARRSLKQAQRLLVPIIALGYPFQDSYSIRLNYRVCELAVKHNCQKLLPRSVTSNTTPPAPPAPNQPVRGPAGPLFCRRVRRRRRANSCLIPWPHTVPFPAPAATR